MSTTNNKAIALRANDLLDNDKAREQCLNLLEAISVGTPIAEALGSESGQYVLQVARNLGVIDGLRQYQANSALEVLKKAYEPKLEESHCEFVAIVDSDKSTKAKTFVLTVAGSVIEEEHEDNGAAAIEFLSLKKAAASGRLSQSGLAFAVRYKDGFIKKVKSIA